MPTDEPPHRPSARAVGWIASCAIAVCGCPEPVTPDAPDAFRIPRDIGPVDVYTPPPPDAYRDDTGPEPDAFDPRDAARSSDVGSDAGSSTRVVVDGRVTERAWDTAPSFSTSEALVGPYDGTLISRFQYIRTADELAIAVAGELPVASSVVVVYLDLDYPDLTDGVLLTSAGLGDRVGEVDSVLSNILTASDPEFRPELGWGAGRRPEAITAGSDTIGWRVLDQSEPFTLARDQRSACSADACEATISLTRLGVAPTQALGIVVRIGDSDLLDTWAPLQTIPFDPDPEFVSVVETIPAAE